jgi:tetratricopeptide (TPR) repeat protein
MLEKIIQKSIQAALNQNWEEALRLNEEILACSPKDIAALNRLALAQIKLGQTTKAKRTLRQVLEFDPSNPIATKNIAKLELSPKVLALTQEPVSPTKLFLQEPGKTKMIELLNPASPETLAVANPGDKLDIVPRRKTLALKKGGACLGSLPEDLSFRLSSLIKQGNRYEAILIRAEPKKVLVLIREVFRSKKMQGVPSFFKS